MIGCKVYGPRRRERGAHGTIRRTTHTRARGECKASGLVRHGRRSAQQSRPSQNDMRVKFALPPRANKFKVREFFAQALRQNALSAHDALLRVPRGQCQHAWESGVVRACVRSCASHLILHGQQRSRAERLGRTPRGVGRLFRRQMRVRLRVRL
jgi:hypothetical protein